MSYQPKNLTQNVASAVASAAASLRALNTNQRPPDAPLVWQRDDGDWAFSLAPAQRGERVARGAAAPFEEAGKPAAKPPVHSNGKSTCGGTGGGSPHRGETSAERTLGQYRLQRHAAKILDWPAALSGCEYARKSKETNVEVWRASAGDRTWSRYVGLQTCKSVWSCPVCSSRRAWVRRGQLQQLIDYAQAKGLTLVMLTLTSQHDLETSLTDQRKMMKKAKAAMTSLAPFKNGIGRRLVGSVTATEVTHGKFSGWHLHFHYIVLLDLGEFPLSEREAAGAALGEAVWPAWQRAAGNAGLYVHRKGWSVDVGETVAAYPGQIEKVEGGWNLADEATRGAVKKGSGRHPFELLRLSCDEDDKTARALFVEYTAAIKGTSALQWSRGLAKLVGVKVGKDKEEEGERQEETEVMREQVGELSEDEWCGNRFRAGVRARRGRMAAAVVQAGAVGFGAERDNGKSDPVAADLEEALKEIAALVPADDVELVEGDEVPALVARDPTPEPLDEETLAAAAWIGDVLAAIESGTELPPMMTLAEMVSAAQGEAA